LRAGVALGAGLGAAALVGCSGSDEGTPATAQSAASPKPQTTEPQYVRDAKADNAPVSYNYPEPDTKPKAGGNLVIGMIWQIATWDINKSVSGGTTSVPAGTLNRLLGWPSDPMRDRAREQVTPELAKSWEAQPDGLRHVFHLQPNVKYQNVDPINGRAFVAQDVVLVYERVKAGGASQIVFQDVDRFSAPDASTVEIRLKSPNPDFLDPLATRNLGIYPMELVDKNIIDKVSIGTGPTIVTEVQGNSVIKFRTNPDYWEGKPLLDTMEYRIIPDPAARLAAFRAGQVDSAFNLLNTKPEVDALLKTNPDARVYTDPVISTIRDMGFNLRIPNSPTNE
jgi:peptide/nickel transport system substrate-binding protein